MSSFPVTPAKARKLLGLGRSARFGRGEETLPTDPDVRGHVGDPKHLVRAEWDGVALKDVSAVKEELVRWPQTFTGSLTCAVMLHTRSCR